MIVEFLFDKFQSYIYQRQFYTFMLEIIVLCTIMYLNEKVHKQNQTMFSDFE